MKYLITLLIAALSLNAFGQGIPQLPYNPDENGDGLIGVPDLQALLAQYGLEFNSAVLSEDAQSAIVYMGNMAHPVCTQACDNLPGFWHMSTMNDLGLVWDEVTIPDAITWVQHKVTSSDNYIRAYTYMRSYSSYSAHLTTYATTDSFGCYCAAHELPKVEYFKCIGAGSDAYEECVECVQQKLLLGWQLLQPGGSSAVQDLWRWAE